MNAKEREGKEATTEPKAQETQAVYLFRVPGPMESLGGKRFRKDIISDGVWVTPKGEKVVVTPERRRHWMASFADLSKLGYRVPMYLDHDQRSEKNTGYLERLLTDDRRLWMDCEVAETDDGAKLGKSIQEVSISVGDLRDHTGKLWEDVILHVAPTVEPVWTEQGNFIPLSRLADQGPQAPEQGGSQMDKLVEMLQANTGLAEAAGLDLSDLSAENAPEKLAALLAWAAGTMLTEIEKDAETGSAQAPAAPAAATANEVAMSRRIDELKRQQSEADAELARLRGERVDAEVDAWRKDGKIIADAAPVLKVLLSRTAGPAVTLSRTVGEREVTEQLSVADAVRRVIGGLPKGACVELGKRSRVQEMPTEGDGEDPERTTVAELSRKIAAEQGIELARAQVLAEKQLARNG